MAGRYNKILIVADDPQFLQEIVKIVKYEYDHMVVSDLDEAMARIRDGEIKVVLCDQSLQEAFGQYFLEVAQKVNDQVVRLLVVTQGNIEIGKQAADTGLIFRFFSKPISQDVVLTPNSYLELQTELYLIKTLNFF